MSTDELAMLWCSVRFLKFSDLEINVSNQKPLFIIDIQIQGLIVQTDLGSYEQAIIPSAFFCSI